VSNRGDKLSHSPSLLACMVSIVERRDVERILDHLDQQSLFSAFDCSCDER